MIRTKFQDSGQIRFRFKKYKSLKNRLVLCRMFFFLKESLGGVHGSAWLYAMFSVYDSEMGAVFVTLDHSAVLDLYALQGQWLSNKTIVDSHRQNGVGNRPYSRWGVQFSHRASGGSGHGLLSNALDYDRHLCNII